MALYANFGPHGLANSVAMPSPGKHTTQKAEEFIMEIRTAHDIHSHRANLDGVFVKSLIFQHA